MDAFLPVDLSTLMLAWLVAFIAAFVKGTIGFSMPTILVSGFTIFMPTDMAIATMIIPSLVSNLQQGLHNGYNTARKVIRPFWGFTLLVLILIVVFAQIFAHLQDHILYILLGIPISLFSFILLIGWRLPFLSRTNPFSGWIIACVSGFGGGIAGIWGPPIVLYLNALNVRKKIQYNIQGIIYGLCAAVFFFAHIGSGIMGIGEFWLSCLMVPITIVGMKIGAHIQDKLNQAMFQRIALIVLIISGLNLIRKGIVGFLAF